MTIGVVFAWLACGTAPDEAPPADGVVQVRGVDGGLWVDGVRLGALSELSRDPASELDPTLSDRLQMLGPRPLHVDMPGDTAFFRVRKILGSAERAGSGPVTLTSAGAPGVQLADAPRYRLLGTCGSSPHPVRGVEPLVTLSPQTGPEGTWVVATARFLPQVEVEGTVQAVDGLPDSCLDVPPCDALFGERADLVAACRDGSGASRRVSLGGPDGCLLPLAPTAAGFSAFSEKLPASIRALGLESTPLLVIMPEATVRLDALLAVIDGFRAAGMSPPFVQARVLVQGNDGPPACDPDVRDNAAMLRAGAAWLGHVRATTPTP